MGVIDSKSSVAIKVNSIVILIHFIFYLIRTRKSMLKQLLKFI
jgi:hypothetical protein